MADEVSQATEVAREQGRLKSPEREAEIHGAGDKSPAQGRRSAGRSGCPRNTRKNADGEEREGGDLSGTQGIGNGEEGERMGTEEIARETREIREKRRAEGENFYLELRESGTEGEN